MSAPRPLPTPKYKITSIRPVNDFNPGVGSVPSHVFDFTTEDGSISSTITIPDADVNDVAKGRELIEARIRALSAYQAMGQ